MQRSILHHAILLSVVAAVTLVFAPAAAGTSPSAAISRTQEPVIVKGSDLPGFLGAPVDQIFVYAYQAGSWSQKPSQVDEIDAGGAYVASEDGLLDANDEIVFMARDLGDASGGSPPVPATGARPFSWYQLRVTDPTHPGDQGWVYIVRSTTILPAVTADYVSFDASQHRITGSNYAVAFESPRPWLNYMALGGTGVDLLDRAPKLRACTVFCVTENASANVADGLIKDGRVRVILREGRVIAYGWMAVSELSLNIALTSVRLSTDFSPSAAGATFYSAAVPAGVQVDGSPDAVPGMPFSSWFQLSHSTGTVVQVHDVSQMGGTPTNYYIDDSRPDAADTGDKMHYGESGVMIDAPNPSFTFQMKLFFLNGPQPNVGTTHAAYASQPLQVGVEWQKAVFPEHQYLPLVTSSAASGRK